MRDQDYIEAAKAFLAGANAESQKKSPGFDPSKWNWEDVPDIHDELIAGAKAVVEWTRRNG